MYKSLTFTCLLVAVCVQHDVVTSAGPSCGSYTRTYCCGFLCWGSCSESLCSATGKYGCICPGNGAAVNYDIPCTKQGSSCVASSGGLTCNRFINCASCVSDTAVSAVGGCSSCMTGYQLISGTCTTDINECASRTTNNCAQNCQNTIGSYKCSCNLGYQLDANRYSCTKLICSGSVAISGGVTTATESYRFGSYVKYACNGEHTFLLGSSVRKCLADASNTVRWDGSLPTCVDKCDVRSSRQSCGYPNIASAKCLQLGCCYSVLSGQPSCYHSTDQLSTIYQPGIPTATAKLVLQEFTVDGCRYNCYNTPWCKTFAIKQGTTDQVTHQTCYLYDQSIAQLGFSSTSITGFDLHEPLSTGIPENSKPDDMSRTFVGCFADGVGDFGSFAYRIWSSEYNSPGRCVAACRQQGYSIAALRAGTDCYCDNSFYDGSKNSTSSQCNAKCAGSPDDLCGGPASSSVYLVPTDSTYIGCYADRSSDPDFSFWLWTRTDSHSASTCISGCLAQGFLYAALQNGSRCYCGNTFGRHGPLHYDQCRVKCTERRSEDCGGPSANAVYVTEIGRPIISDERTFQNYNSLYSTSTTLVAIPMMLFTTYPRLKSIFTPRLIIRVTESVVTPTDSHPCGSDACYSACGQVSPYESEGLQYKGRDQTVRFFFINLSQLKNFVGADAQRVFLYAQTVVIDTDLSFPFSLQVHARQLILNRQNARTIRVSSTSPTFNVDFSNKASFGLKLDSLFLKQSFVCAQILLDTRDWNNRNLASAILADITRLEKLASVNVEQQSWIQNVRIYHGAQSGVLRQNIHFVPYLSKDYFAKLLRLYADQIALYKTDFERQLDATSSQADYARSVADMQNIFAATSVDDANRAFDTATLAVIQSNATYQRMWKAYQFATTSMDEAGKVLSSNSQQKRFIEIALEVVGVVTQIIDFFSGMVDFFKGWTAENEAAREKMRADLLQADAEHELEVELNGMAASMQQIAYAVVQVNRFVERADDIAARLAKDDKTFDFTRYADDITNTANLKETIVQWSNLKNNVQLILTHPKVQSMRGSAEYLKAVLDWCRWGEALTNSAVEFSELLRDAIQKLYNRRSKQAQAARYTEYFNQLKTAAIDRQQMTAAMVEQQQEVRIDLNNVLMSFCQAYFYENSKDCKPEYKPSFGGTLSQLLIKINAALKDSLLVTNAPSTVSREVDIVDQSKDANCSDAAKCPLKYFRDSGVLVYKLDVDNWALRDLFNYRVDKLELEFVGARQNTTTGNKWLKVLIESNGVFRGRDKSATYDFLTTPLSLAFETNVVTDRVSILADVYAPVRDLVQHFTPYTTWVIRLSDFSRDIDLSQLNTITMRFDGSAVSDNNWGRRRRLDAEESEEDLQNAVSRVLHGNDTEEWFDKEQWFGKARDDQRESEKSYAQPEVEQREHVEDVVVDWRRDGAVEGIDSSNGQVIEGDEYDEYAKRSEMLSADAVSIEGTG